MWIFILSNIHGFYINRIKWNLILNLIKYKLLNILSNLNQYQKLKELSALFQLNNNFLYQNYKIWIKYS